MHEKYKESLSHAEYRNFKNEIAQREVTNNKRRKKQRLIKNVFFFGVLLFYLHALFISGYGRSIFQSGDIATHSVRGGNPGAFLSVFILGALFIWVSNTTIQHIQNFFLLRGKFNRKLSPLPPQVFRFFGWVIYITPAIVLALQYF